MVKQGFILFVALLSIQLYAGKKITVPDNERTIKAALEQADAGDTVFVRSGIYHEQIALRDEVALIGESTGSTVISGSRSGPVVLGARNALLKNFTIRGGDKGILCENVIMTIEHNCISNNHGIGIHCLLALPSIRNNIICRNGWSGIYCETVQGLRAAIENNVIAENNYCGLVMKSKTEILVQNNLFLANKQFGVWASDSAKRSRILSNDFYMNRSPYKGSLELDRTNFSADPQYQLGKMPTELFSTPCEVLRGKGKDGADIGLVGN